MGIKNLISDPLSKLIASVDNNGGDETNALVVATRPLKTYTSKTSFFINPTYGIEMAQDASYGGSVLIFDGTDTAEWDFTEPTGTKWEADSEDRPYADSKSLKCDNPNVNDVMQIANDAGPGTNIDLTPYTAITFWINVDKDWAGGDSFSVYGYLTDAAGAQVGTKVYIEDYFDYSSYDIWHYVDIPLADMGLSTSTIDAFRIENEAREGGKSPEFYIDEWYIQETGASITYTLEPDEGTWFHIKAFQTVFVDAYSGDNADSTVPQLSYDQILGVTTTTGYIYRSYQGDPDTPTQTARVTKLMDLLSYPYSSINNHFSDGTNTMITIANTYPPSYEYVLKSEDRDKLTFTVEGKMDDLLYFRISAQGYVEQR